MADPSPPPRSKAGDEEGRMEVRLRGEKIYTLADDIVLLAEEEDMRAMIARLERYVREKRLEVNVGK